MNEFHICRACGHVLRSADASVPVLCPSCCATTWMILAADVYEMCRQLKGVNRKHTMRMFRAVYRRVARDYYYHRKVRP